MKRIGLNIMLLALLLDSVVSCNSDRYSDGTSPVDLSAEGTANCYIVSQAGDYSFPAVVGNSLEPVGNVASAEVLWESFASNVAPKAGDLVSDVSYKDGKVIFKASGKKGNAVIAAKDNRGTILWSWHIWLTDTPKEQVYANNAGTMMDRNLGAISAVPGNSGSYGLLYQWGRKDPFLGSGGVLEYADDVQKVAASSIEWPDFVPSDASKGTIEYAVANPTTYIMENDANRDWHYTGDDTVDKTRWQPTKTIYDPCPAGWVIPECGPDGIWGKALGTTEDWENESNWDSVNFGIDFSKTDKTLGSEGPIWYPAAGLIYGDDGNFRGASEMGGYWSVSNSTRYYAVVFAFGIYGYMLPNIDALRAYGCSVRCQKIK